LDRTGSEAGSGTTSSFSFPPPPPSNKQHVRLHHSLVPRCFEVLILRAPRVFSSDIHYRPSLLMASPSETPTLLPVFHWLGIRPRPGEYECESPRRRTFLLDPCASWEFTSFFLQQLITPPSVSLCFRTAVLCLGVGMLHFPLGFPLLRHGKREVCFSPPPRFPFKVFKNLRQGSVLS